MKIRKFENKNYKGIFVKGQTLRIAINSKYPILELDYPEFYDISITDKCFGNCEYCYQDSLPVKKNYENILEKVNAFFGSMSENEKPFQVAIGGGEPTLHPDFINLLKLFKELDILPNYTTNGMWVDGDDKKSIIKATKKYCGGVAVSTHKHLKHYWENAANALYNANIFVNLHIIISDKQSVDEFVEIYNDWNGKIKYFVLLPYTASGRASNKNVDTDYLFSKLPQNAKDIAFGANFYNVLRKHNYPVYLYEPEMFSKYLSLKDNGYLYSSSFSDKIIKNNFLL